MASPTSAETLSQIVSWSASTALPEAFPRNQLISPEHPHPTPCSPGAPGSSRPSWKLVQLVHRASWENAGQGTLTARPRAVQLRCGWHRSELELLVEKVPGGTAGTACSGWGYLGMRRGGRGQESRGSLFGGGSSSPLPHPPGAATPAPGGQDACSRQKPACSKKPDRHAAGAVVGGPARPRLLLTLPADDVAVAAALQVVPKLCVVARRAGTARRGTVPATQGRCKIARGHWSHTSHSPVSASLHG